MKAWSLLAAAGWGWIAVMVTIPVLVGLPHTIAVQPSEAPRGPIVCQAGDQCYWREGKWISKPLPDKTCPGEARLCFGVRPTWVCYAAPGQPESLLCTQQDIKVGK